MTFRADIEKEVFQPKSSVKNTNLVRINVSGESDEKLDKKFSDSETCASVSITKNSKVFRVKLNKGKYLYNPLKNTMSYGLDKVDKTSREPLFKFQEVNEKIFNGYVNFLKKREESILTYIQREI